MANTDEPNLINFSSVGEPSKVLMDKVGIKRRVSIDKTKKEVDNTTLIENLPLVSCSAASDQVDVPKQSQKKEEPEPPQHQNFIVNEPKRFDDCIKDCERAVERGKELRSDYKMIARALTRKGTALAKMAKCITQILTCH
ncbi:hypothetical protein JHK87_043305 [Glycine soja]|nr:hypothetical protein JHK87_043305 [Glycine soja]